MDSAEISSSMTTAPDSSTVSGTSAVMTRSYLAVPCALMSSTVTGSRPRSPRHRAPGFAGSGAQCICFDKAMFVTVGGLIWEFRNEACARLANTLA